MRNLGKYLYIVKEQRSSNKKRQPEEGKFTTDCRLNRHQQIF